MNNNYELHPLCTYFPRMGTADFDALKVDIQSNGQTHPIYTLDGMILDGGNRYRALCELGMEPVVIEYTGTNPTQFILSSNLHRRHLTQGQSAAIVSASQNWANAQAEGNLQLRTVTPADTAASRAKQSGVGQRTQQMADKLVKEAPEALIMEVIDGKKSLLTALKEIAPEKPEMEKPQPVPLIDAEPEDSSEVQNAIVNEQQSIIEALQAENAVMLKVFEADDRVSASLEEVSKLTEVNRVLNSRFNDLMVEKTEAIKVASYWENKFLQLEAELNNRSDSLS
jgi:ParB-like chromosome segregation protein Spo0J